MESSDLLSILGLSIRVSGTAVVLAALIGVPLGSWLGLAGSRTRAVSQIIFQTGMATPPVVLGLWLYILLSRSGPLAGLGWLYTPAAMILAQAVLCFPFVVGITMNAVASVPAGLIPQLRSLGASEMQIRWTILREAKSGVLLAIAAALGRSLSEVGAVLIVGGNIQGHTRVLTTAIVLETGQGNFDGALALGFMLLFLALGVNSIIWVLQSRLVGSLRDR